MAEPEMTSRLGSQDIVLDCSSSSDEDVRFSLATALLVQDKDYPTNVSLACGVGYSHSLRLDDIYPTDNFELNKPSLYDSLVASCNEDAKALFKILATPLQRVHCASFIFHPIMRYHRFVSLSYV